jgi:hypothetical protein
MVITRANVLKYWLREPEIDTTPVEPGYIMLDFHTPPFPDFDDLNLTERKAFGELISHHPEYLQFKVVVNPRSPIQ